MPLLLMYRVYPPLAPRGVGPHYGHNLRRSRYKKSARLPALVFWEPRANIIQQSQ